MTRDALNCIEARVAHNTLAGLTPTQAEQALEDRANLVAEVRRLQRALDAATEGFSDASEDSLKQCVRAEIAEAEVERLREALPSSLEAAYDEGVSDACDYLDTTPIPTEAGLWDESNTRRVAETLGEEF